MFIKVKKSNRKEVKMETPNTYIHDHSLSCLAAGTTVTSGRVSLVLRRTCEEKFEDTME